MHLSYSFKVFARPLIPDPSAGNYPVSQNNGNTYHLIRDVKFNQMHWPLGSANDGKEIKIKPDRAFQTRLRSKDRDRIIERSVRNTIGLNAFVIVLGGIHGTVDDQVVSAGGSSKSIDRGAEHAGVCRVSCAGIDRFGIYFISSHPLIYIPEKMHGAAFPGVPRIDPEPMIRGSSNGQSGLFKQLERVADAGGILRCVSHQCILEYPVCLLQRILDAVAKMAVTVRPPIVDPLELREQVSLLDSHILGTGENRR